MEDKITETLTLHAYSYRDKSKILKLYTQKFGLISVLLSYSQNKKPHLLHVTNPFCIAEATLYKKGNFFFLKEVNILDIQIFLRNSYSSFMIASKLVIAILQSQSYEKTSPNLYALIRTYLKQIPQFINPKPLLLSFYLKLLLHEGILRIEKTCCYCQQKAQFLSNGNSVCSSHQSDLNFRFSENDWDILYFLCNVKKFSHLKSVEIPPHFSNHIEEIFKTLI